MARPNRVLVEPEPIYELVRPDGLVPRDCARGRLGPAGWRWAEASSPAGQLRLARWSYPGGAGCVVPEFPRRGEMADRLRWSTRRRKTGELPRAAPCGRRLSCRGNFSRGDERGENHGKLPT